MKYFFVNINMVDGNSESFNLKSDSKVVLKNKITEAPKGWFGVDGSYVQIKNITSLTIDEINLNDYEYEDNDFYYVEK
ncbi:hypothetical protein [Peribacillus huizhouensis]|uniref:Phage protein n=1 Tax=Peribacillus huizhouensis TaxID=1501239 RepID=A0ABR6CJ73_9BACI|nr:hypothetical protein [Peribacillus huizhouensis]MBA9024756.1 hypothetical protein [Peribacillus huizhouensis]